MGIPLWLGPKRFLWPCLNGTVSLGPSERLKSLQPLTAPRAAVKSERMTAMADFRNRKQWLYFCHGAKAHVCHVLSELSSYSNGLLVLFYSTVNQQTD